MAIVVDIPFPRGENPDVKQRTVVDGVELVFQFQWNERAQRWYLSIFDANEAPIQTSVKLVPSLPLTNRVTSAAFPNGNLFVQGEVTSGFDAFREGSASLVYVRL